MADVLERRTTDLPALEPGIVVDERPARRSLLEQVEHLEGELCSTAVSTWPRKGIDFSVPAQGGPRLLTLGELEQLRDDLAERLAQARDDQEAIALREEAFRCLIEEMLLHPEQHKWRRVTNADIGEPGCKNWHVKPRWGVVGVFMNWWRVKISSGCPLAGGCG